MSDKKAGEISCFDKHDEDDKQQLANKPFSSADAARYMMDMGQIFGHLGHPQGKLLDLGCGTGWTSWFYARRGFDVLGTDISGNLIDIARSRYQLDNLEFAVMDYEESHRAGEFDYAVFYDSLHHAEDENKALQCAYNALRPGGRLVILEPGTGHELYPATKEYMKKYGVTERGMPPRKVMPILRKLGFKRVRAYSRLSLFGEGFFRTSLFRKLVKYLLYCLKRHYGIVVADK